MLAFPIVNRKKGTGMEVNGTTYKDETPEDVIRVLERARMARFRIRVDYGDTETGESWGESFDTTGYVGRSMGPVKIPILVHNARSMGGGGILDHCIVRIEYANKRDGGVLYEHPTYIEAAGLRVAY